MNRRRFLTALSGAAGLGVAGAAQSSRPPNIVFVLADDLGYGELGCQGNGEIPTPNIDSIAANGARFTNGYVTAPVCCPSRAGLMTGRYQTRFGHERNLIGKANLNPDHGLPLGETTLAARLRAGGYRTGLIGKWHLGGTARFHPRVRGFDEFFGFLHEGHFYYPPPYRGGVTRLRVNEPPYDEENPVLRDNVEVKESSYLTDAFGREAAAFIERNASQPFFLYVALNAIHSPMQAPVPYLKKFEYIRDEQRRLFAAMTASMDEAVGTVLAKLRDLGLEQNTLVVFLSDNGGPTAELTSSNAPLRGGKGQLYEGGIRVPFLMQWKGRIAAGQTVHDPVISLDLIPTVLEAASLGAGRLRLDGVSLLGRVTGREKSMPERALFWRYNSSVALRRGDWKIVRQAGPGQKQSGYEMFNLKEDPAEMRNRAGEEPGRLAGLRKEWDEINRGMVEALW
ncbi:MAG: sulfatase [Bryobacterales bacterium]|nr:sulfatase [Bryobacterales bacterium]